MLSPGDRFCFLSVKQIIIECHQTTLCCENFVALPALVVMPIGAQGKITTQLFTHSSG